MSKISLAPNISGSAVYTIASPAGSTDRTLNLPDAAGTVDTLQRAGNVLQVLTGESGGSTTTSDTLVNLTSNSINITPKSTNSVIHIIATFGGQITAGGVGTNSIGTFRLMEGLTGFGPQNPLAVQSAAGANVQTQAPCSLSQSVVNNSTSTRSFTIGGFRTGGTSAASILNVRITLIEVAA